MSEYGPYKIFLEALDKSREAYALAKGRDDYRAMFDIANGMMYMATAYENGRPDGSKPITGEALGAESEATP